MTTDTIHDGAGMLLGVLYTGTVPPGAVAFPTPGQLNLQVGVMNHVPGHVVPAHYHEPLVRSVVGTPEVLLVRAGSAEVRFYDGTKRPVRAVRVVAGDVLLIVAGGHEVLAGPYGFEAVEVKQGPYLADDKVRFVPDEALWGQIDKA